MHFFEIFKNKVTKNKKIKETIFIQNFYFFNFEKKKIKNSNTFLICIFCKKLKKS